MPLKNEKGATMMEAALAALLIFTFIGAITDFGLALRQYNLLSYRTNKAAREISVRLGVSQNCDVPTQYLREIGGSSNTAWSWCIVGVGKDWNPADSKSVCPAVASDSLPSFSISGVENINCFFLCRFFPSGSALRATVTAAIDNPNVRCPSGGKLSPQGNNKP